MKRKLELLQLVVKTAPGNVGFSSREIKRKYRRNIVVKQAALLCYLTDGTKDPRGNRHRRDVRARRPYHY